MIERQFKNGLLIREIVHDGIQSDPLRKAVSELEGDTAALSLMKAQTKHRVTIGVAYPANSVDPKKAADGRRDFAPPEVVEQIAWRWMKERQNVGLLHKSGTDGHGIVVESGIHRGPDWVVDLGNGELVKACDGDWILGVEWPSSTWGLIEAKFLRGYSPQGDAQFRVPSSEALAQLRS